MPCILQVLHIGFASGQFKRFSSPDEIFGHQQYVGFIWQISNTNKDVKKNCPYFAKLAGWSLQTTVKILSIGQSWDWMGFDDMGPFNKTYVIYHHILFPAYLAMIHYFGK